MSVILERIEPIQNAVARLRTSPLEAADDPNILIYANATMRVCEFFTDELNLTALYVLNHRLERMRHVRHELIDRYEIDILNCGSVLHVRDDDGKLYGIAPPFVEIYEEKVQIIGRPGDRDPPPPQVLKIPILKDGMHRAWLAREEGVTMRCLVIHGALPQHLPYAYPNAWHQVQALDEKPELKKYYRRKEPYTFMRPLKVLRQTGDMPPPPEWGR